MYRLKEFRFFPTKKYIFKDIENKNNYKSKYIIHKLAPKQIDFNNFHTVKPFNRFGKTKIYNSGLDPQSCFVDFINKDPDKPYKRHISPIITKDIRYTPSSPFRWDIGCTKSCHRKELLPKLDPYKEYNFLNKSYKSLDINSKNNEDENYKINEINYLPTDHISIREPKLSKSIDNNDLKNFPFLKLKGEYCNTSDSNSFWVPRNNSDKSLSNKSSVDYNIINNKNENFYENNNESMLNKTLFNKKKGIAEFESTQRLYGPHFNQTFLRLIKENGDRFKKYRGIFSELYDSAIKNGNIYVPFHERKENEINIKSIKLRQKY